MLIQNLPIDQLGLGALTERSWTELLGRGFPRELVELSRDLGQLNERPIRVFTLPTLEAGGDALALPFLREDGILFDPSLLRQPHDLRFVVVRELAHLLYPGWASLALEGEFDEMWAFGRVLAPRLLRRLPRTVKEVQPMVAAAMARLRAA